MCVCVFDSIVGGGVVAVARGAREWWTGGKVARSAQKRARGAVIYISPFALTHPHTHTRARAHAH